ncbi:hypothetical protein IP364_00660 [Helicobacter winghamensis]
MIDTMIGQNYLDLGNDEEARVALTKLAYFKTKREMSLKNKLKLQKDC